MLCKIGNVETYLKWTFLRPVENAITRSCSLAKKGKCKALPVCQTNFEILKVWIAFLYQVPQVLTHAVWRTEGNYEFVPTRGTRDNAAGSWHPEKRSLPDTFSIQATLSVGDEKVTIGPWLPWLSLSSVQLIH